MLTSFKDEDPSGLFASKGGMFVDAWVPVILQKFALEAGFALGKNRGDSSLLGEAKDLADRISWELDLGKTSPEMKSALLASLREETFGCSQGEEGGLFSLAILRYFARLLRIPRFAPLELLPSEKIPKRTPRYEFQGDSLSLAWSRGKGLSWAMKGLRSCLELFSLEVQGDRGGLKSFSPGLPERPRRFLAAHMRPFSVARKKDHISLGLRREIRLPVDPEKPKGRFQKVDWELEIRGDLTEGSLETRVSLRGLPPGQRVRLLIPIPFFPRPVRWESLEGIREHEGPCSPTGFRGPISVHTKGASLEIGGPGWREMEVFPSKNDFFVALTLYRAPSEWQPPSEIVRRVSLRV
jgi:hypothetical protein